MLKVSVIVPVYNPGEHIEACIRSLLHQSMSRDEYELIFVDDGSTDGTAAKLDALAAEHDNVRVEHIPNSGWPGRPRNVGIDMARGEFVYFVDNDDWIEHEALERLYARATKNEADIVLGKVVGHGKYVPRTIFRRNRADVGLGWSGLLGLLTPHKLFRRSMLVEHGIRFPEGRRRLEDHVFTVHAYFHARRISVLADHPIYHWVLHDENTNASFGGFEPVGYYENVREVLDLVVEHTEPGEQRDQLLSHWYRGKMLGRVGGRTFARYDEPFRRSVYDEVRRLALERFTPEHDRLLAFHLRVRAHLLREGRYGALLDLANFEWQLEGDAVATDVRRPGGEPGLLVDLRAELVGTDEQLRFRRDGERVRWVPPPALAEVVPEELADATQELSEVASRLLLRSLNRGTEYVLPIEGQVRLVDAGDGLLKPVLEVGTRIVRREAAAGATLPDGEWAMRVAVSFAGFNDMTTLRRPGVGPITLATGENRIIERGREMFPSARAAAAKRRFEAQPWVVRAAKRARARVGAGA